MCISVNTVYMGTGCGKVWKTGDRKCAEASSDTRSGRTPGKNVAVSCSRGMSACSSCAGDYEDPDRTAWAEEGVEDEEKTEEETRTVGEASGCGLR